MYAEVRLINLPLAGEINFQNARRGRQKSGRSLVRQSDSVESKDYIRCCC